MLSMRVGTWELNFIWRGVKKLLKVRFWLKKTGAGHLGSKESRYTFSLVQSDCVVNDDGPFPQKIMKVALMDERHRIGDK